MSALFDAELLSSVLRATTPVLLAALGGLLCSRAGVFNIALEGFMLLGAFAGVAGAFYTGDPLLGVIIAATAATALAALLGLGTITLKGDAIVLGVALNLLAAGATGFLLRQLLGATGTFTDPSLRGLGTIEIPGLSAVPFLGDVLSGHSVLVYLSWVAVAVVTVLLFKSPWGLRLRGVGEQPQAAQSLGVSVTKYQYTAVLVSGVLCGLAGAQLALGNVTLFSEGMTAGRGWIAVVAVMLARDHPIGALGASLLFGLAEGLGFRLQGEGLPQQFTDAAPYVVTLLALLLSRVGPLGRRRRARAVTGHEAGGADASPTMQDRAVTQLDDSPVGAASDARPGPGAGER